ncbi:MAG TPA: hypothetical protein VHE30_04865, partial [Polyangiaceae bacterium]|nr:hypothetical protein [Polyangiaceae bacterium]
DRPHWVITDVTQPPGDWSPRRADWKKVLEDEDIGPRPTNPEEAGLKWDRLVPVVHLLSAKNPNPPRLTAALRQFATKARPMALWAKSDCSFDDAAQPKVSSVSPAPDWFTAPGSAPPPADGRVYMQAPGSFVFTQICSNCHGRLADSKGRLASKILELTGGDARVANFGEGLFGPSTDPGAYRKAIFEKEITGSFLDVDDWGSRYMAFMGLGGTTKAIPKSLISVVGLTPVFGVSRVGGAATDANMLAIARRLCSETLPYRSGSEQPTFDTKTGRFTVGFASLQEANGDAQLWRELCNFANPSPVRVINLNQSHAGAWDVRFQISEGFYKREAFSPTDPVGDQYGTVTAGVASSNLQPWCLRLQSDTPEFLAAAETWWEANRKDANQVLPKCPSADVLSPHQFVGGPDGGGPDWEDWVNRAGANAGFSVFAYLDDLTHGRTQPADPYNGCPTNAK